MSGAALKVPMPFRRVQEPIAAVTFDVGGTLIRPWPSVGHVYAQVAASHGAGELEPQVLNARFARVWRNTPDFPYTRQAWARLVDETFSGLTRVLPSRSFFDALYLRFVQADVWQVFPDVEPTLQGLAARGLELGVISNWDRRLAPLLCALNLHHRFKVITVSCHARSRKPARAIFEQAARRLGFPPGRILHVGDHRELDWGGARAAGFQARWLCRERRGEKGREEIRSLRELVEPLICRTDVIN